MKKNFKYNIAALVLGSVPFMAQANHIKSVEFVKNSSVSLSQLLADRMACLTTQDGKNALQDDLIQGFTLEAITNDFITQCNSEIDKEADVVHKSDNTVNRSVYHSQEDVIEAEFLERFKARSGTEPSEEVKAYAKVLAKAIVDSRVHGRRMNNRGWSCKAGDEVVALIHSRLNEPTANLKAARKNEVLSSSNSCASLKMIWGNVSYDDSGLVKDLSALKTVDSVTTPVSPASTTVSTVVDTPKAIPSLFRHAGSTRMRNRVTSEEMTSWNECGGMGFVTGRYFAAKRDAAKSPAWPSRGISRCSTSRKISKAFATFLSQNLGRCAAMGTVPEAQQVVRATLNKYKRKTKPESVDRDVISAVKSINEKHGSLVNQVASNIASIEILHQGVQGDSNHRSTSNHAANVLRAIDISHIRITFKDGKKVFFEHGVAGLAENSYMRGTGASLTEEQKQQSDFWSTFNSCMSEKGAGTISKTLSHTGTGLAHTGHTHLSLPYPRSMRGPYNSKYEDSFHEAQLVLE